MAKKIQIAAKIVSQLLPVEICDVRWRSRGKTRVIGFPSSCCVDDSQGPKIKAQLSFQSGSSGCCSQHVSVDNILLFPSRGTCSLHFCLSEANPDCSSSGRTLLSLCAIVLMIYPLFFLRAGSLVRGRPRTLALTTGSFQVLS